MKAVANKILLAVNTTQKTDFEMKLGDSGVTIHMIHGGFDQKITGATMAQVVADAGEYKEGDMVLTHHNAFNRDADGEGNMIGDTKMKTDDGRKIFSIELPMVFLRVENGLAMPTPKYLIAQRIPKPSLKTSLYLPEMMKGEFYLDRFVVLRVHESSEFQTGDVVYTDQYGGLPVRYVYDKEEVEVIRIAIEDVYMVGKEVEEVFPDCLEQFIDSHSLDALTI